MSWVCLRQEALPPAAGTEVAFPQQVAVSAQALAMETRDLQCRKPEMPWPSARFHRERVLWEQVIADP